MALRGAEVHEAPISQHVDATPVRHQVLARERPNLARRGRLLLQRTELELVVEVAGVGEDRAVGHQPEVLAAPDVEVARAADEELADPRRIGRVHDPEAVHGRLEAADRVDLADHDVRPHPVRARRDAPPDPAVSADDDRLAGEEDVRRPQHAIDGALAGAVSVVEQVLGQRLVDRHHRVCQLARVRHGTQPDDARRRLLGAADDPVEQLTSAGVELVHQVSAIVHGDLRLMVQRRADVRVVGVAVLALDRVRWYPVVRHQGGRHVVLGRERVRRAEDRIGSALGQGPHQVGRLGGDVQAGADAPALERALGGESLADPGKHRHLAIGPFDLEPSGIGQADVGDVVLHFGSRCHGIRIASRIGRINPQPPARRRARRSMSWQWVR